MAESYPSLLDVGNDPEKNLSIYLDNRFPQMPKLRDIVKQSGIREGTWPLPIPDQESAYYRKTTIPARVKCALYRLLGTMTSHKYSAKPGLNFSADKRGHNNKEACLDYTYQPSPANEKPLEYFTVSDNRDYGSLAITSMRNRTDDSTNFRALSFLDKGQFRFDSVAKNLGKEQTPGLIVRTTKNLALSQPLRIKDMEATEVTESGARKLVIPANSKYVQSGELRVELPLADSVDEIINNLTARLIALLES